MAAISVFTRSEVLYSFILITLLVTNSASDAQEKHHGHCIKTGSIFGAIFDATYAYDDDYSQSVTSNSETGTMPLSPFDIAAKETGLLDFSEFHDPFSTALQETYDYEGQDIDLSKDQSPFWIAFSNAGLDGDRTSDPAISRKCVGERYVSPADDGYCPSGAECSKGCCVCTSCPDGERKEVPSECLSTCARITPGSTQSDTYDVTPRINEDNTKKTSKPAPYIGYILVGVGILTSVIIVGIVMFKKIGLNKYVPSCPRNASHYVPVDQADNNGSVITNDPEDRRPASVTTVETPHSSVASIPPLSVVQDHHSRSYESGIGRESGACSGSGGRINVPDSVINSTVHLQDDRNERRDVVASVVTTNETVASTELSAVEYDIDGYTNALAGIVIDSISNTAPKETMNQSTGTSGRTVHHAPNHDPNVTTDAAMHAGHNRHTNEDSRAVQNEDTSGPLVSEWPHVRGVPTEDEWVDISINNTPLPYLDISITSANSQNTEAGVASAHDLNSSNEQNGDISHGRFPADLISGVSSDTESDTSWQNLHRPSPQPPQPPDPQTLLNNARSGRTDNDSSDTS